MTISINIIQCYRPEHWSAGLRDGCQSENPSKTVTRTMHQSIRQGFASPRDAD